MPNTKVVWKNAYMRLSEDKGQIEQGGLNKKEIQLNLCNVLSIYIFNELHLFA